MKSQSFLQSLHGEHMVKGLLLKSVVLVGCYAVFAQAAHSQTAVLATAAAGVTVTQEDVLSDLQRAPEAARQNVLMRADSIEQLVYNLMVRRTLASEAARDGLDKDPLVAAALTIARDRVMSDARLARLDAQNTPTEKVLESYARESYKVNQTKFERPAQTRARHILIENKDKDSLPKAQALLAQIRAGASFEELAKTHSADPGSAAKGGDLGFFAAGQMVRPFEEAANALAKPGDVSEPVESQFGYHIIKLEERRKKGVQSYEEVREQLIAEARTTLLNESRVQKVQSLRQGFNVDRAAIEAMVKPAAP